MRNIYVVNAMQIVISDAHPEGICSAISGYPKTFDSKNYNATEENPNGDSEAALRAAKSECYSRMSANYSGSANRVMAVTTLEDAYGRQILRDSVGEVPDLTPPEPEPEPIPEPEIEPEQPE